MALSTLETLRLTVAALRQRTGESQAQLAASIDLTQDKVSRRQSGAQPWTLDEVDALARHWGLAPLDLLAGPTHAAQSMTWPPGTAAPQPQLVPATFTPAAPAPVPAPAAAPVRSAAPDVEHQVVVAEQPAAAAVVQVADYDRGADGLPLELLAAPCEYCGRPVRHRIGGRPLHLGGFCAPAGPAPAPATPAAAAAPAPVVTEAASAVTVVSVSVASVAEPTPTAPAEPAPAPAPAAAPPAAAPRHPVRAAPVRPAPAATPAPAAATARGEYAGTGRDLGYYLDMITTAVEEALEEHDGDTEAASAALEKRAIPNGMALFEATRVGAAYEHTVYPDRLEFLSKKTRNGADEIWEGRHKWENAPLMEAVRKGDPAEVAVDVLDTNAAYCSALKTHLPIGSLVHDPNGGFDPKRSGIYLLPKRPTWEHPTLPDPIGNRHESGPVLLDGATVRLLARCHKLGLTDAPHITEAWTSGASEGLLEKFRRVLTQARENAIHDGDTVTEKYVKAIYAKFASTIGESTFNRDIRRPDWMHIIRSQAFANLWYKAHRAHTAGLTVVRLRGTDELHVTGDIDWRTVFAEGRLATQMKLKDQYTLPTSRKRSA
ncbi:helix-turn-helix domain-containing protein (plasmid) [Kitasatospora sp. NBC_00070]|uniref:helix-turn-helix domain-containing protein n=1 Tax=Kitasatospora sp. NBC_00070 TaxID=2975962 RepID=UPI002F90C324